MTATQRQAFETALLALESGLQGQTPLKLDPNRSYEAHPADAEDEQPLNEMLQAIASGRNRQQAVELEGVRRALRKLRDTPAMFGLCEECEEPIAAPRLKARPQTAPASAEAKIGASSFGPCCRYCYGLPLRTPL